MDCSYIKKSVCAAGTVYMLRKFFYFNEYLDDPYGLVVFTTFIL